MKKLVLCLFGLFVFASAGLAQNVTVNPGAGSYATLQGAIALDMRNNIIVNNSVQSGSGLTIALRRDSTNPGELCHHIQQ